MKPCPSRREAVALLACGACPDDQAAELRRHLQGCAGCRESFQKLVAVCEEHAAAARQMSEVSASSELHFRVASRIRAESEPRRRLPSEGSFAGWGWMAGVAVLVVLLVSGLLWYDSPAPANRVAATPAPAPSVTPRTESAPVSANSLRAYRLALNRSPEAFDALLSQEAARPAALPQIASWVSRTHPDLGF